MPNTGTDAAADLAKQLITLSTGLTALTVTFSDKFRLPDTPITINSYLVFAWITFILTVVFGVWSQMAITGTINKAAIEGITPDANKPNIRIPALLMILAFSLGLIFTTLAGYKKFKEYPSRAEQQQAIDNPETSFDNEDTLPSNESNGHIAPP